MEEIQVHMLLQIMHLKMSHVLLFNPHRQLACRFPSPRVPTTLKDLNAQTHVTLFPRYVPLPQPVQVQLPLLIAMPQT